MKPVLAMILLLVFIPAHAQEQEVPADQTYTAELPDSPPADPSLTVFPHPERAPYLLAGQANIIFQAHGPFHSPYEGQNSLLGRGEYKTSLVGTLFLGLQLHPKLRYNTDAILDVESAGGRGISQALGLAGFTNLDVVRNPSLGSAPYIGRVMVHQIVPLSHEEVESERTPLSLAP